MILFMSWLYLAADKICPATLVLTLTFFLWVIGWCIHLLSSSPEKGSVFLPTIWVDTCKEHTVFFMDKIRRKYMPCPHTRSSRKSSVWSTALLFPHMSLNESFTFLSRATSFSCSKNNNSSHWHSLVTLKKHIHSGNSTSSTD